MRALVNIKNIMILGAGVYQVPLIKTAQKMGLKTLVVSHLGKYPGIPIGDLFLEIDTTDADRIVTAARTHHIAGIVTSGTDVCIPSLGKVVDALNLPGTGFEAAQRSMDKVLMRQAFMKHNVRSPSFQMFTCSGDAKLFASRLGYPVMVKAPDSSGSRGITKASSENEFQFAWDRASAVSRSGEIIVEQFLDGMEFGAQAFVHGREVVAVFPHGDTVTPGPFFSPIGHSMPLMLSEGLQSKTARVIEKAVQALGIKDCISNVDLMLVEDEPYVIEIGARMGATCLPECVSIFTGMNAYEHVIRLALGEHPPIHITAKQPNACRLLRSAATGRVTTLSAPDRVLNHPDLIDLQWDVAAGDTVRAFEVGPDRIGHIIVKGETADAADRLANDLSEMISVSIVPSAGLSCSSSQRLNC